VRDVVVDALNRVYLLVERSTSAGPRLFHERFDRDAVMHQETRLSFPTAQGEITGLTQYEGATVWVSADGYFDRSYVVTGGTITLAVPAREITIGRWRAPMVTTLPLPRLVGERTHLARPVRVHTVRAKLAGTSSIAIAANGQPARDVPLLKGGVISDQPVPPSHEAIMVTGLAGYSDEGFVTFTQVKPGKFAVRDFTLEART
jgi:hypothetical protein